MLQGSRRLEGTEPVRILSGIFQGLSFQGVCADFYLIVEYIAEFKSCNNSFLLIILTQDSLHTVLFLVIFG